MSVSTAIITRLVLTCLDDVVEDDSTDAPLVPKAGNIVLITIIEAKTAAIVNNAVVTTLSILFIHFLDRPLDNQIQDSFLYRQRTTGLVVEIVGRLGRLTSDCLSELLFVVQ